MVGLRLFGAWVCLVVLIVLFHLHGEARPSWVPAFHAAHGGFWDRSGGGGVDLVRAAAERAKRTRRRRRRGARKRKPPPRPRLEAWDYAFQEKSRTARRRGPRRGGKVDARPPRRSRPPGKEASKSAPRRRRTAGRGRRGAGPGRAGVKGPRRAGLSGRKPAGGGRGARARRKSASPRVGRTSGRPAGGRRVRPRFDGRSRSGRRGGFRSALAALRLRSYSPSSRRSAAGKKRVRRFRPPKLSVWLGTRTLKPPTGKLSAPTFAPLKGAFPPALPDGKPYDRKTPPPGRLERLAPPGEHPDYERWLEKDRRRGRKDEPHWHIDGGNAPFYHLGKAWGVAREGSWAWMIQHSRRWWTVADQAQRMVRHAGHWWWRTRDGWFLLHEGEPWAWRHFADWRRDGLLHPGTETRIVYSEDGRRVAVRTPGHGTRVFDARTGDLLWDYPERATAPKSPDPGVPERPILLP